MFSVRELSLNGIDGIILSLPMTIVPRGQELLWEMLVVAVSLVGDSSLLDSANDCSS